MSNAKLFPNLRVPPRTVPQAEGPMVPASVDPVGSWTGSPSGEMDPKMQSVPLGEKSSAGMPRIRLNRVIDFVDANIGVDLCVSTLAGVAGMSSFYFCRSFKQSTGITPLRYVLSRRMEHAKRLLQQKSVPLLQVAHQVGFNDQSQFTRVFHKMVGITPSQYRKYGGIAQA